MLDLLGGPPPTLAYSSAVGLVAHDFSFYCYLALVGVVQLLPLLHSMFDGQQLFASLAPKLFGVLCEAVKKAFSMILCKTAA